jgi:hypothetical protein
LASREFEHTGIVRIVHKVLGWVSAGIVPAGAGVPTYWTTKGGAPLGWSVGYVVVLLIASTLEGVIEPEPVADLVSCGVSQVVWRCIACGE